MKKVLAIFAIAAIFTACNNESSTEKSADTTVVAPVITDTSAPKVDTSAVKIDTSAVKVDTTAKH